MSKKIKILKSSLMNHNGVCNLSNNEVCALIRNGILPAEAKGQPIFSWLIENNKELLEQLINDASGEEINIFLKKAVQKNDVKGADYLISKGANVSYEKDINICVATFLGYTEMVDLLVKAGADVNAEDGYPIQVASAKGFTEIVGILCDADADATLFFNYAIKTASENKYYDIVTILEENGGKLDDEKG